jgi:hypothetical protein
MTTPMSNERLAEIKKLDEARTPGEWITGESEHPAFPTVNRIDDDGDTQPVCDTMHISVARFIAACSTAIPDLLAEVERLKHIMECADTPLMRDVLQERDAYRATADRMSGEVSELCQEVERLKAENESLMRWRDVYNDAHDKANADAKRIWELRQERDEYKRRLSAYLDLDCPRCMSSAWDADADFCMLCRAVNERDEYKAALEACNESRNSWALMNKRPNENIRDTSIEYWLEQARAEHKGGE